MADLIFRKQVKGKRSLFAYLQQVNRETKDGEMAILEAKKEFMLQLVQPTFSNLPPDFTMVQDFNKFMSTPHKDGGAACARGTVDVERCLDKAAKLWERCVMFRSFTLHKASKYTSTRTPLAHGRGFPSPSNYPYPSALKKGRPFPFLLRFRLSEFWARPIN